MEKERCTYDPKLNYNTPIMDNIMIEQGWTKFEDVPLFYKEVTWEPIIKQKYFIH